MVKIFSRHRDWDAPTADGDERAADLEQVEMLLAQLGQPALPEELRGEEAAVSAIAARIRIASASEPAVPRAGARRPRRSGRVLAIALGAFSLTTGGAFAGVLPDAVQKVAHEAFQKIGVTIPEDAASARSDPQDGMPGSAVPGDQTPGEAGSGKANGADTPAAGTDGGEPTQGDDSKTNNGTRNHGANGEGKNAHGQETAAANGNGKGKGHVKTQGNPHGSPPAHGTGGQPPAQGGGKPADTGPKPGTGGGPKPGTGPKPDGEAKGGGPKK